MNGRVYDPLLSMFLSPDNNLQSPDFTQNYNRYAYCLNNPLKYTDLSGDTYKAYMDYHYGENNYYHRGDAPGTWSDGSSGGSGGYYYNQYTGEYKNEAEVTVDYEEVYYNYILPNSYLVNNPQEFWKDVQKAYYSTLFGISDYDASLTAGPGGKFSFLKRVIPDKFSISIELKVAVVKGISQNIELNWLLHGPDASILPFVTNTLSKRTFFEGDAGISFNAAWYLGDPNEIKKSFVYGPSFDIDAGCIPYGGTIFIGYDNAGKKVWIGGGSGFGGTFGISWGNGITRPGL